MTPTPRERAILVAGASLSVVATVAGWWWLWFLCDDAYIAFRYVGMHQEGWGYTWNPPPFRPVEGYTSFLWVRLLDLVWTLFGVEPPRSANVLGLFAAFGSLLATGLLAWRTPWSDGWHPHRAWLTAAVLGGTATNLAFLTWTTSGLETPLFVALLLAWVGMAWVGPRTHPGWVGAICLLAALLTLTRPDGLLFMVATVLLVLLERRSRSDWSAASFLGITPLALPVVHVLWRYATYGAWLPNTHAAKDVGWWPEAGLAYLASFALDQAWALWLPLILALGWTHRDRLQRPAWWRANATDLVVVGVLAGHLGYYVLRVGGDHFGFRILAHLPPLLWLLGLRTLDLLEVRPRKAALAAAAAWMLGTTVSYTDQHHTSQITSEAHIKRLTVPLTPELPWLGPWVWAHDALEGWLTHHSIGIHHTTHKWFAIHTGAALPPRAEMLERFSHDLWGEQPTLANPFPVTAAFSVGVLGWRLQRVAVLDKLGLNDRVVAHTPVHHGGVRRMAHARRPPPGYVACFSPDVRTRRDGSVLRSDRSPPLTAAQIRTCETRPWPRDGKTEP